MILVDEMKILNLTDLNNDGHLRSHMAHYASHISSIKSSRQVFVYYRSFKKADKMMILANFKQVTLPDNVNLVSDNFTDTKQLGLKQVIGQLKVQDIILVKSFDHLADNLEMLGKIVRQIFARGGQLIVLNYGHLANDEIGQDFLKVLDSFVKISKQMHGNTVKAGKVRRKLYSNKFIDGRPKRKIDDRYLTIYKTMIKHKMSYQETADTFNVSKSTVYRIKKQIERE